MKKLGERIRRLRKLKKLTQQDVANHLKISRSTVAGYETNESKPSLENIRELAKLLDVSVDFLLSNEEFLEDTFELRTEYNSLIDTIDTFINETNITIKEELRKLPNISTDKIKELSISDSKLHVVPVLCKASTKKIYYTEKDIIDYDVLHLPTKDFDNYFLLEVGGDSMSEARIYKGDRILVLRTQDIKNNDIVVMESKNNELPTIKRYRVYNDGSKWAIAENPNYPPIELTKDNLSLIIGKGIRNIINL